MTDQNIPNVTDDDRRLAREWAAFIESRRDNWTDRIRAAARVILNAGPAPPLPTLADMTEEERAACQWMQADVADHNTRYVIANPHDRHGEATLIAPDGQIEWILPDYVTPRPDLPRMEWPAGDQEAEDANTVKVGDVIESAADPRLAALPTGSALLDCDGEAVAKRGEVWVGDGYIPISEEGGEFGPWTVLHISKGADK